MTFEALAAARRARRLTARADDRAVAELDALDPGLVIVGVDEALAQRADLIADERALCGYDAVRLASALALGPGETILASWGRDLSNAAVGAGLAVAPLWTKSSGLRPRRRTSKEAEKAGEGRWAVSIDTAHRLTAGTRTAVFAGFSEAEADRDSIRGHHDRFVCRRHQLVVTDRPPRRQMYADCI